MLKIKVLTREGQHEYGVPQGVEEITFSAFLDFRKWEEMYFKANEGQGISRPFLEKALSFIIQGPIALLPFHLPGDDADEVLSRKFNFSKLSMLRLYGHLVTLINEFEGDESQIDSSYQVDYKGETYYVEPDAAKRFLGVKTYETGEVIEVDFSDAALTSKIDATGDETGSLEFERELRAMAVLLRKENEQLPFNVLERKTLLEQRMLHFRDLTMDVVLNVRFFLQATMIGCLEAHIISTSTEEGPT